MSDREPTGLSYRDAGVDIDAGNRLVARVRDIAARSRRPEVLGNLGGFGALCELPSRYREPVLVAGTDGVGTKLRLAMALGRHDSIGLDLVAMCVNDLVVAGAEPLFFLDYYATGRLDVDNASAVIDGIGRGCEAAGCALVGGETAEMPGMYTGADYDLAGFCVGVVEKAAIIDGSAVRPGDALVAIGSTGPHSNGYSLIRRVLERSGASTDSPFGDGTLGDALLEPTRIYVHPVLELVRRCEVHGLAHITGGGLGENLARVLPDGCRARVDLDSWERPAIFQWLAGNGQIAWEEMYRTFNCGVGMVACVPERELASALDCLQQQGLAAWHLGRIEAGGSGVILAP